jgi:CRISPR system Cascade subunit CasC
MSTFIQLHLLTSYPPANLNRDDLGRPKTAVMGGVQRLRVSSQSLKRAWRISDLFEKDLNGIRTKDMGKKIRLALLSGISLVDLLDKDDVQVGKSDFPDKDAKSLAWEIASCFVDKKGKSNSEDDDDEGAPKDAKKKDKKSNIDKDSLKCEQLVFYSRGEIEKIDAILKKIRSKKDISEDLKELPGDGLGTMDVAMFGRMLANSTKSNIEAAVQVAHAITVHKVAVEDDYFTAVDDLNKGEVDSGSAHIGETAFAAGLFYQYVCINWDLLVENLSGDKELAGKALRALAEAATTIAPSGKQNSFASRAYASFAVAEKSDRQPRTLSVAFLKPVEGSEKQDVLAIAKAKLRETRDNMDKVYWGTPTPFYEMDAMEGKGSLKELLEFVSSNGAA